MPERMRKMAGKNNRRNKRVYRKNDLYRSDMRKNRSGWNKTRIIAACACFVAAIGLIVVIVKVFPSANEAPDNTATRLAELITPTPAATSGAAVQPEGPTPEPTPKHRKLLHLPLMMVRNQKRRTKGSKEQTHFWIR